MPISHPRPPFDPELEALLSSAEDELPPTLTAEMIPLLRQANPVEVPPRKCLLELVSFAVMSPSPATKGPKSWSLFCSVKGAPDVAPGSITPMAGHGHWQPLGRTEPVLALDH